MATIVSNQRRAFGPDFIRAAAIVLVLLSHTFPGGTMFPALGVFRYFAGVLGVEIFFLLSGYLIGGILMADLFAGRLDSFGGTVSFWKRRWFRTLPNYYLFLCFPLVIDWLAGRSLPAGIGNYFWFGQALFSPDPDYFTVVWSLAIEEWFYLLFPLVLFLFSRVSTRRQHVLLATIIIFLVVPVIIRSFISPAIGWDMGIRRVTLPRLDAIGYGVVLAFLKNYYALIWNFLVKIWPAGVLALLGLTVHFCHHNVVSNGFSNDTAWYRALYFNVFSLAIALSFPKAAELSALPGRAAMVCQKLSLWSYSMYLSHVFCITIISIIFNATMASWHRLQSVIEFPFIWLMTIVVSALLYRFFEKPLMDLRDRPMKSLFRRPK